jgi:hypothetical protein
LAAAVCRAVANIFPGFANGFLNGWPTQSAHWISDTCVACGCTLSRPFSLCFCWPTEIESEEKRRASHIVCFLTRHFDSPLSGRPLSLYSQIKMGAGAHYKARHPRVIFSSFYFYLYFFFFFFVNLLSKWMTVSTVYPRPRPSHSIENRRRGSLPVFMTFTQCANDFHFPTIFHLLFGSALSTPPPPPPPHSTLPPPRPPTLIHTITRQFHLPWHTHTVFLFFSRFWLGRNDFVRPGSLLCLLCWLSFNLF